MAHADSAARRQPDFQPREQQRQPPWMRNQDALGAQAEADRRRSRRQQHAGGGGAARDHLPDSMRPPRSPRDWEQSQDGSPPRGNQVRHDAQRWRCTSRELLRHRCACDVLCEIDVPLDSEGARSSPLSVSRPPSPLLPHST